MVVMPDAQLHSPDTGGQRSPDGDEVLVERFRANQDGAFSAIVERYRVPVATLAHRLLGYSSSDVEDICQDVFVSAYRGLGRFRGQCGLKTWLFKITINKCRTYRYRRLLRLRLARDESQRSYVSAAAGAADGPLMDVETAQRVRQAVQTLPRRYREPVVLRYLGEMSADEAAAVLGITTNALSVRLSRARQMLKDRLTEVIRE